jgi:hypothetical protein
MFRRFALLLALGLSTVAHAQTVSERVLGTIKLEGPSGPGIVVSVGGSRIAKRERVPGGERFVTVDGPGETFDELRPGAVWIEERLVYFAKKGTETYLVDGKKKVALKGRPTSPVEAGRPWPSRDRRHYMAFTTDGKKVSWYLDGKLQQQRFSRLVFTDLQSPVSTPLFAATVGCDMLVVGLPPFVASRWDLIRWIHATDDGSVAYIAADRANKPGLYRNGKVIFSEPVESFATSTDGKVWVAVVDKSTMAGDRLHLIRDGVVVTEALVDSTRQQLYLSDDGTAWVWQIYDEDYVGSTLRRAGQPDRHVALETAEFQLSQDGSRTAIFTKNPAKGTLDVEVDGVPLPSIEKLTPRSFRFGTAKTFAYERGQGEQSAVASHLGQGVLYDSVSRVLMLPDGRPAYIARRGAEAFAVVGVTETKLAADHIHSLDTLRLEGGVVRVLGTRGDEVVDFTISPL